jgi:CBS domain-containing membrane protein
LKEHAEPLDIAPDDLEDIVLHAEQHAWRRHAGHLRCADVMSQDVVTIRGDLPPIAAWELLNRHRVKALPVLDENDVLTGILSLHDLVAGHGNTTALPALRVTESIAQLMSRKVVTARPDQPIEELVPLFADAGYHHIPVVDARRHVVGMITQSDLIAALYRAGVERAAA